MFALPVPFSGKRVWFLRCFFFVFFRVGIATTPKSGEMVKQFKMFDMVSPFLISISFFDI